MRSREPNRKTAIKRLERDLINGPNHCFGIHDACSSDFCSTAKKREEPTSSNGALSEDPDTEILEPPGEEDNNDGSTEQDQIMGTFTIMVTHVIIIPIINLLQKWSVHKKDYGQKQPQTTKLRKTMLDWGITPLSKLVSNCNTAYKWC